MIIYKAQNLINNKIYIGQTVLNLETRKRQHINAWRYGKTYPFALAIKKYGIENFSWEIIFEDDFVTIEELNDKESYYIKMYNSSVDGHGYNLRACGENKFLSEETKLKISEAQRGEKNHMYGKTGALNPTSKRVKNITTGVVYDSASECSRIEGLQLSHICSVCRGDRGSTGGFVFRYINSSGDIIEPSCSSNIKSRPVRNIDTGECFNSAAEAEKYYLGKSYGGVSRVCQGSRKLCAGYRWEYI